MTTKLGRSLVPLLLGTLVLAYEILWKSRIDPERLWSDRVVDLLLLFLIGPVMAWWGLTVANGLLRKLAKSEAASEEKNRLLELRNRQLQTVLQASRAMGSFLDLPQVAQAVIDQVSTHTRFTRAVLVLAPDDHGGWSLGASQGLPSDHLEQFMAAMGGPLQASSPVEWCRVTRQPVVVEDLRRDFRTAGLADIFTLGKVEAMVAAPLVCRERFRGALVAYLEEGGPISTGEISLLSALASQAALALENAKLYTVTAQHRARLDQAVEFLESVASGLARTKVGVNPLLQFVAQVSAKIFSPARASIEVTVSGRRSPYIVEGSDGLEDHHEILTRAAALPITLDGNDFGHFHLDIAGPDRTLGEVEGRILKAFVHLASSALSNASLVADMRQAVDEVERAYMGTLEALIKALEIRDHETEGHSRRVVQYTLSLAHQLEVPEHELVPIMRGALLHDIGKIGVPDAILRKPGPLTDDEWEIMRQHTRLGYAMLNGIDFLASATGVILHHHERYDGKGYPDGRVGDEIPLGARIFAVADAYDAITSNRPYRIGRSHVLALTEISAGAGTQFDAAVVQALLALPEDEFGRIRGRELERASS